MKNLIFVIAFSVLALAAQEQTIKLQPFVGSGVTRAWATGIRIVTTTGGVAAVVPLHKKFFLRPMIAGGKVVPLSSASSFPVFQAGALLGYRVTKRFSVLGGYLETIQFPKSGALYLPTAVVSTATRIHGRWGIYTPIALNRLVGGCSVQIGYNISIR